MQTTLLPLRTTFNTKERQMIQEIRLWGWYSGCILPGCTVRITRQKTVRSGSMRQHGMLLTVEPGVLVAEVVKRTRAGLKDGIIVHEHISS